LVRLLLSKIFRPEANPFSLALSSVQGANALALGRQILLYSPALKSKRSLSASEMDALALGSHFCSLSSAGVTDTPVSGSRIMPPSLTPTFLKRQRNGYASVGEPISAPFSTLAFLSISVMGAPASGSQFLLPFQTQRDDVSEAELAHYASALGPNSYHSP
jgi:hypothetical protein